MADLKNNSDTVTADTRRLRRPWPAKFSIPPPGSALVRPRLLDGLQAALDRPLQVIHAPAGYGKTVLAAQLADDTQLPVCWYTLDPADTDPASFIDGLLASLRSQFPDFGRHLAIPPVLRTPWAPWDWRGTLSAISALIEAEVHSLLLLVLDDYRYIAAARPVNDLLNQLFTSGPSNLRTVVLSRALPGAGVQLGSLAAARQVALWNITQLRFTDDEARTLAAARGVAPNLVDDVVLASQGWPMGLVVGMRQQQSILTVDGTVAVNESFDSLAEPLLMQASEELREALMMASVAQFIDCSVLRGIGTPVRLDELARVVPDSGLITALAPDSLVIHNLFRSFLSRRFQLTDPAGYRRTVLAYGRHLQRRGRPDAAISLLLDSGHRKQAEALLQRSGPWLLSNDRIATLDRLLNAFRVRHRSPSSDVRHLAAKIATGRHEFVQAKIDLDAAAAGAHGQDIVAIDIARAELALARQLPSDAAGFAQAALQGARTPCAEQAQAVALLGIAAFDEGDLAKAEPYLAEAQGEFTALGSSFASQFLRLWSGRLERRKGKLRTSSDILESSARYFDSVGAKAAYARALSELGCNHYLQGEYDLAASRLSAATTAAAAAGEGAVEAQAARRLGDVYRDIGLRQDALDLYSHALRLETDPLTRVFTYCSMADTYRHAADFQSMNGALGQAKKALASSPEPVSTGIFWLTRGLGRASRRRLVSACRDFEQAGQVFHAVHSTYREATALYYLAYGLYLRRRVIDSDTALVAAIKLLQASGCHQALLADASTLTPFLRDAATRPDTGDAVRWALSVCAMEPPPSQQAQDVLTTMRQAPIAERRQAAIKVRTLGRFQIRVGDRTISSRQLPRYARELLVFLVTQPGPTSRATLLQTVFAGLPRGRALSNLHNAEYQLRRALGRDAVMVAGGNYQLATGFPCSVDCARFRHLITRQSWTRALRAYRGMFMPDHASNWIEAERREVLELFTSASIAESQRLIDEGRPAEATAICLRALSEAQHVLPEGHAAIQQLNAVHREATRRQMTVNLRSA